MPGAIVSVWLEPTDVWLDTSPAGPVSVTFGEGNAQRITLTGPDVEAMLAAALSMVRAAKAEVPS